MSNSDKLVALVGANGGYYGPDLCKELGIEQNRLANALRGPLAQGKLVVEKRVYPGTNRKVTYCLPNDQRPDQGPRFPEGLNTADPFGLVNRRATPPNERPDEAINSRDPRNLSSVAQPERAAKCVATTEKASHDTCQTTAAPVPSFNDEWRERALAAERMVVLLRAKLTTIGVSAIQDASLPISA